MKSSQVLLGTSAVIAAFAFAQTASAESWYGAVRVGQTTEASVSGISFDDDLTYSGAVGTNLGPLRVEAGVARLSGEYGGGALQADALDWNATAYLDIPVGDNAKVFAGAGVDYIVGSASIYGFGVDADGQGYHYSAGASYRISERFVGELMWTHREADLDTDFGSVDLSTDEVTLGIRAYL